MNGSQPCCPSGDSPPLATIGARHLVGTPCSPSPRPSPPGRGGNVSRDAIDPCPSDLPSPSRKFPLSPATLAHRICLLRIGWGEGGRRSDVVFGGSGEGLGVRAMGLERAGVRGNAATFVSMAETLPGTVKLDGSPGTAGNFSGRMSISSNGLSALPLPFSSNSSLL